MIKNINTVPNQILKIKAINAEFTINGWNKNVLELVQDLKDTANFLGDSCAGLASNQIWDKDTSPLSIFVVRFGHEFKEFINPIIKTSGKTIKTKESCFSVPNTTKSIKREVNVTITYQTANSIEPITIKYTLKNNDPVIAIQHEFDHLRGKVI